MCLLIVQPAGTQWTQAWIEDFHSYNPDGVGVMWAENGYVHVEKIIPKKASDVVTFLEKHQGRECAIHYRWATHGDVDLENCHPYELLGEETGHPMYLMHNGVLSQGNNLDKTKSDTHQFIRTHLRPLLDPTVGGNPDLMFEPVFIEMLGSFIGSSNKFVVVDYKGRMATVNESAFVDFNGAKLSNTYAWSAPGRKVSTFGTRSGSPLAAGVGFYGSHWADEDYDLYYGKDPVGKTNKTTVAKGSFVGDDDEKELRDADDQAYEEAEYVAQMIYSEMDYLDLTVATEEVSLAMLSDIIYYFGSPDDIYAVMDKLPDGLATEQDFIDRMKEMHQEYVDAFDRMKDQMTLRAPAESESAEDVPTTEEPEAQAEESALGVIN